MRKGARVIVVGTPPPQSSGTGYWAGDMFVRIHQQILGGGPGNRV